MLKLIFILIMFGVTVDSCDSFCDCEKSPGRAGTCDFPLLLSNLTDSSCSIVENHADLISALGVNNVAFLDHDAVEIKTGELRLNFSDFDLNWIKKVSFSESNLTFVPDFLADFSGIESLDLSRNEIEFVNVDLLATVNLIELNISSNIICTLNGSELFQLKNLTSLDVSYNELSVIDEPLQLPGLQYLNLSNNKLKVLSGAGFNDLRLLQHLDISRNRLVRIAFESIRLPNLSRLLVAGNAQLGKSRDVFVFVGTGRKLKTLDASRTGLKQVPASLTHSIQSLRLTENSIKTINCGDLDAYPLLRLLDLTSNNIKFVEEDSLGRLEFLSSLYLSRNELAEIPKRLPEKLKVLHLDINKIRTIRNRDLQGLTVLEVLLLNDNNLTVINEGAFSELISLVTLDLSRNPLINLQTGIFSGPLSLGILRLSSIAITSTNEDNPFPLSVPERLLTLDLSRSPGLARQFLSDTATLMAAKRLEELDLSDGNLECLRQDLQFFLPQLKVFRFSGNKFNETVISSLKSWLCETTEIDNATQESIKKSELTTAENINEFNEVYYDGDVSKFSQDSPGFYNKKPLVSRERHNELVRSSLDEQAVDKREDSIKWNVSNGEISMYTSEKKNYFYRSLFLVLSTALIVFTISLLLILRLVRHRRAYVEDIEATALPTISDIW